MKARKQEEAQEQIESLEDDSPAITIVHSTSSHQQRVKRKVDVETPIPYSQLIPLIFVVCSESLGQTVVLPFVGLLVARLQERPPEEAGYMSGLMVSIFMFGQIVSARFWGWFSDVYGRRVALISGLYVSGFFMLFFGLGTTVWACAGFRFLHGLFNGNVLVSKTVVADISDRTNQAKAFAFISFCGAFGYLIGPALGGLLYDPSAPDSALAFLNLNPNGLTGRYPAILPAIFLFFFSMAGVVICTLFVRESNPNARPLPRVLSYAFPCLLVPLSPFVLPPIRQVSCSDEDEDVSSSSNTPVDKSEEIWTSSPMKDGSEYKTSPLGEEPRQLDSLEEEELAPHGSHHHDHSVGMPVQAQSFETQEKQHVTGSVESAVEVEESIIVVEATDSSQFGYREAFCTPVTRFVLVSFMLLCAADSAFKECFPLWTITSAEAGGLGFGSKQNGYILLLNSFPIFGANYFFAITWNKYRNKIGLYRMCFTIAGCSAGVVSLVTYLNIGWVRYLIVVSLTCTNQFVVTWCYMLINILTARAARPGQIGAMMSINQSCGSASRSVIPLLAAPVFAWSISGNHVFPFDHVLIFFWCSAVYLCAAWITYSVHTTENETLAMVGAKDAVDQDAAIAQQNSPHHRE